MTAGVIVHTVNSPYMFLLYARYSTRPENVKVNKMKFYPLRAHRLVKGENKQTNC